MKTMKTASRPLIAALALGVILSSCGDRLEPLVIDLKFSCNIFRPGFNWPGRSPLTTAQQNVLAARGEPAFVRLWFNPAGEYRQLSETFNYFKSKTWPTLKRSWVYLDTKEEVVFISAGYSEVQRIDDMLMTLCRRGDPEDTNLFPQGDKDPIIEWVYYSMGERYKFISGILIKKSLFPRVPNF